MIPIGLGLAWAGYTLGIWGYCLVRDYNVPFTGLFRTTWPGATGSAPGTVSAAAQPTPTGQLTQAQQLTGQ